MKILFVDDDAVIRRLGRIVLESAGETEVTTAASGTEALALAADWQPDLIVLDYMMPGMDGAEVFATLRASSTTRSIPVVFLTGLDDGPERETLLALGAAGCIGKPFDPMALPSDLAAVVESSGVNSVPPT